MNIERLISSEPFNKWLTNFLREYTRDCKHIMIEEIGTRAASDIQIVDIFTKVLLKERANGFISRENLYKMFCAWYELNSAYHVNYSPPKMELDRIMASRYSLAKRKGVWGYPGIALIVDTPEEALELMNQEWSQLEHRLPNFRPDQDQRVIG